MTRPLDRIAEILRGALPDGERIAAIVPMTTGFSNDTYLVEGPDLILRLPPAASLRSFDRVRYGKL